MKDLRSRPQISVESVFCAAFLLFAERLKSLNALEEQLRLRGKPLVPGRVPSADTIGYAYSRMHPRGLREILRAIVALARRNKALRPRGTRTPWTAAIDGHEFMKSYHRNCAQCLERRVRVGKKWQTQYYHHGVVAHLVEVEPLTTLDTELLRPFEDEAGAGRRLVLRLLHDYPFIEIFNFDAGFLEAPTLRPIVEAGRAAIVVLKEERRELYRDAMALFAVTPPRETQVNGERIQYWDISGFTSWDAMEGIPIRVVRTIRYRKIRERIARQWKVREEAQDWMWATVGLGPEVSALTIHRLGHARWDEEEAFNEEDREYGLDHNFKHSPLAILGFVLTLFLAAMLTELFFTRNLKDPLWRGMTLAGLAVELLISTKDLGPPCIWASPRAP